MKRIADFDIAIGRRVRLYRMHARLSQTEVADAIGITFQQLQKYESGTNRVSAGKLLQIARILAIPVATFFEGLDGPETSAIRPMNEAHREIQDFVLTSEGHRLVQAFSRIESAETRRSALRMLESISAKSEA